MFSWEMIKKPVSFLTALKSGKRIKHRTWIEYCSVNEMLILLSKQLQGTLLKMVDDEWCIE